MKVSAKENFVRHVGGSHVHNGVVNGSAFERTFKDDDGLSIVRRGFFTSDGQRDIQLIRQVVSSRRHLGRTSAFAELNVGVALQVLHEFELSIAIAANPLPAEGDFEANPAHALILGLPFKGEAVGSLKSELAGDLLARKILAIHPAVVN